MIIRPAKLSDIPQIEQIDHACFSRASGFREGAVENILREHPETLFLVAEKQGMIVGYTFIIPQDGRTDKVTLNEGETHVLQVATVAVDPAYRKEGVARSLLEFAADQARSTKPGRRIIAEARLDNEASRTLLRSLGYEPLEHLSGYYPDGADALRFGKVLLPCRPALGNPGEGPGSGPLICKCDNTQYENRASLLRLLARAITKIGGATGGRSLRTYCW